MWCCDLEDSAGTHPSLSKYISESKLQGRHDMSIYGINMQIVPQLVVLVCGDVKRNVKDDDTL